MFMTVSALEHVNICFKVQDAFISIDQMKSYQQLCSFTEMTISQYIQIIRHFLKPFEMNMSIKM